MANIIVINCATDTFIADTISTSSFGYIRVYGENFGTETIGFLSRIIYSQNSNGRYGNAKSILQFQFSKSILSGKRILSASLKVRMQNVLLPSESGGKSNIILKELQHYTNLESILTATNYEKTYEKYTTSYSVATGILEEKLDKIVEFDVTTALLNNLDSGMVSFVMEVLEKNYVQVWMRESGAGATIEVTYEDYTPSRPEIIYPSGNSLEKSLNLTFEWVYRSNYGGNQTKYELDYRMYGSTTWNNISGNGATQKAIVTTTKLGSGTVEWRVRTYNEYNKASEYSYTYFTLIDKPVAPSGINITNNCRPKIAWNTAEQDIYELELLKNKEKIMTSGYCFGKSEYMPNLILENGTYEVKIRIKSPYDIWSDWAGKIFTLDPTGPQKPSVKAYPLELGVKIVTDVLDGDVFVYRKVYDEHDYQVIGRVNNGEFLDYTVVSGVQYTYKVRSVSVGYADSDAQSVCVSWGGIVIAKTANPVNCIRMYLSEGEYMDRQYSASVKKTLVNYIGRKLPVKESDLYITEIRDYSGVLSQKEFDLLNLWNTENAIVIVRDHSNVCYCDISSLKSKNIFFDKALAVSLSLQTLMYDKGVDVHGQN